MPLWIPGTWEYGWVVGGEIVLFFPPSCTLHLSPGFSQSGFCTCPFFDPIDFNCFGAHNINYYQFEEYSTNKTEHEGNHSICIFYCKLQMQFLPVKLLSNIILVDSRLRGLLEELYPAVPDDGTMALIEMANLILDEFLKMSNLQLNRVSRCVDLPPWIVLLLIS